MNFFENPKLYIIGYYDFKKNKIDIKCEKQILSVKDELEKKNLNELRQSLVEQVDLAKETVLARFESWESKFTKEMLQNKTKQVKDEIFLDQYCSLLRIHERVGLFEHRFGLLLFSEFDDGLLRNFK